jgi:hypothetical protein
VRRGRAVPRQGRYRETCLDSGHHAPGIPGIGRHGRPPQRGIRIPDRLRDHQPAHGLPDPVSQSGKALSLDPWLRRNPERRLGARRSEQCGSPLYVNKK